MSRPDIVLTTVPSCNRIAQKHTWYERGREADGLGLKQGDQQDATNHVEACYFGGSFRMAIPVKAAVDD